MTIRNALIAASAALALGALASASLAATVSATAPATVTIMSPVTITKTQNLVFGKVTRPTTGANTISMDASGVISKTGGGNAAIITTPGTSAAKFDVVGSSGQTFTTLETLSFTDPGLISPGVVGPVASNGILGTIPAGGTQELRYGGSFGIDNTTPIQDYSGTLQVTVTYN
jgi:hypothetical protein